MSVLGVSVLATPVRLLVAPVSAPAKASAACLLTPRSHSPASISWASYRYAAHSYKQPAVTKLDLTNNAINESNPLAGG
jgi:hypothetical protein